MSHFRLLAAMLIAASIAFAAADRAGAQSRKPKAPPGRDPGGIAIAIVGHGVNYLRPEIAPRLARDGEGEPIAWDLGDNDNRPIERHADIPTAGSPPGQHTLLAHLVLREAGASRLVIARRKRGDRDGLARATAFAAQTPARIILLLHESAFENWELVRHAGAHFRDRLLIVPAHAGPVEEAAAPLPNGLGGDNVIVVTAPLAERRLGPAAWAVQGADIAAPSFMPLAAANPSPGPETAAARIAALAARLLAAEPQLEGAGLKARIVALAKPAEATPAASGHPPVIAEPHRPFRTE